MPITELTFVWLGSIATLATIGMFHNFGDGATRIIVSFVASILWGAFGMSGFNVIVDDAATVSEPILPLAFLGIAFSVSAGLFAFYNMLVVGTQEIDDTSTSMIQ